ncbi:MULTISPECIES: acetoacetate decarboxylase [unclassified Novosphingobium]|uniref:acetoacetate decarboxylase n=1 Tax=unclassified Novosphingobium TaxID=2644732 RepID=UPI00086CF3E0|nr:MULTISPECIES: acetoacetate decarboxylase [unclassified Novosphingobium]MBN9144392.1 acetoacetate decarboxylase [Novosphingobium sp.]MDR6707716.1 acetoacetate decarboxylase [Novosphingobium sp. 1748]NKI98842.1 acetoacetate decarboxylase [Novosphingobium sp. SG707]ODU83959.1 MAG: acetoacetate decarboxylase [Novosphingobium sp. SCN 63-17]OJX93511.1 MAG: acetoacetate decarboxylase [Novosphingobium sp. 63-713]
MKINDVKNKAFAIPFANPSYPRGPFRFYNREFVIITYRTDIEALRAVVPEPLEIVEPVVKYEFIRMPDSVGFGDYTETGQVIPVRFEGREGNYTHAMYLDAAAPIVGGREIWGFPKKLAKPNLRVEGEVLVGTLDCGSIRCVNMTMGYKHEILEHTPITKALELPNFLLKSIPHVDGTPRICELVEYHLEDYVVKGAWSGPASLQFFDHVRADVSRLPVREVLSAVHFVTDVTLGMGKVVHDYMCP